MVRSHRLAAVKLGPGDGFVLAATVPEGERWLVKDVTAWSDNADPGRLVIFGFSAEGVACTMLDGSPGTKEALHVLGSWVLEPGDGLYCLQEGDAGAGAAHYWVSGVRFLVP